MSETRSTEPALVDELRRLIVDSLMLEEIAPDDIDPDAPLFGGASADAGVHGRGLGLDSIDVLELAMALLRGYGVKTRADDENNREIFRSVRTLAAFVAAERDRGRAKTDDGT